ncbi:hypothetical protein I4U23_010819 [Adineta vaga]|nr:hypothetical protein I4U23_010819 [Adineta vaga]
MKNRAGWISYRWVPVGTLMFDKKPDQKVGSCVQGYRAILATKRSVTLRGQAGLMNFIVKTCSGIGT